MIDLSSLYQVSNALSRSICAENPTGEPGRGGMSTLEEGIAANAARDLGTGWKVNPYIRVHSKETVTLAEIDGPGVINHIWCTPVTPQRYLKIWRYLILRIYWDGQENPSVECPLGDFFCMAWNEFAQISSLAVCVNPGSAFNCYWRMPFRKKCRITLENVAHEDTVFYYQVDYTLEDLPENIGYFHAQFRRVNPTWPVPYDYVILDGVHGKGHYVGTFIAWGSNCGNWWGEGEVKFYIDSDGKYPTLCSTGLEDYFGGGWCFMDRTNRDHYAAFSTLHSGFQPYEPDRLFKSQFRFGMYRWHLTEPVYFEDNLRVTVQCLGNRDNGRFMPEADDVASVAYWYQTLPTAPFPPFPCKNDLEIL